jgi:DNA polymerase-4
MDFYCQLTTHQSSIRKIIHVDMDAFFASVEQRDFPEYRGKPLAVGGSAEQRGVVAAASYEARRYGVHSAMPSRIATQRCPHLILVRPRFDVYREVSEVIREIFHRYTDLVEPLSLDEAYLDVSVNKFEMPSATLIAREIKAQILEETRLTASAGVSINKFLAKTASGMDKPDGLFLITPDQAQPFIEQLPIEDFYGIGKVTAEKMRNLGVRTGADLKGWTESQLVQKFGKAGSFYYRIVRGMDDREVVPNRVRKSIGAEESFAEDLVGLEAMMVALEEIAVTLKNRLERHETGGRTLTLKVKYSDYQQVTRSRTCTESIADKALIVKIAAELLSTTEVEQKRARLLGLTLSNLDCDLDPSQSVQLTIDFV